jgi:hypothetical protein
MAHLTAEDSETATAHPRWKCPACQTVIRVDGDGPQANRIYRCSVCRLELIVDEERQKLIVAPLPDGPVRRDAGGHN